MDTRRQLRSGFTLVELLVVIAIIAVLIGLLIPAVQRVRESANRTQCTNNLKQVALSLQSYHDLFGSYPAGYRSGVAANGDDLGPGWGWASAILPQIEKGSLSSLIQFDQPIEAPNNKAARLNVVTTYLCPSDVAPSSWIAGKHDANGNMVTPMADVASANYVGVFGISEPGVEGDGIFFRNSAISFRDIGDGTSTTIMIGERCVRLGNATWAGSVTGSTLHNPGTGPHVEDGSSMTLGEANHSPGSIDCEVNEFASMHGPGANFAFCDGHVAFIPMSIKRTTFQALATRDGGEKIEGEY